MGLQQSWVVEREEIANAKCVVEVDCCTIFRCKALKMGDCGCKLQLSLKEKNLTTLMKETLLQCGWSCKAGPAPRGGLERQTQAYMDRQRRQ